MKSIAKVEKQYRGKSTGSADFAAVCRLVDISCLAMFLRNFPLGNLTEQERDQFLCFQNYIAGVEASCFDGLGFE